MRNLFTFFAVLQLLLLPNYLLIGQCVKEISTDPTNPINEEFLPMLNGWIGGTFTVNPFLNTGINWYPSINNNSIKVYLGAGWYMPVNTGGAKFYPMDNPFSDATASNYLNTNAPNDVMLRDFRWEDGWELLWSNLGMHPNGDLSDSSSVGSPYYGIGFAATPHFIPYFVLYNRYRGTVRVFSSLWLDSNRPSQKVDNLSVRFRLNSHEHFSGLFRNIGPYDTPLDEPIRYRESHSTKEYTTNIPEWHISEFQVDFDPCICLKRNNPNKQFQSGFLELGFSKKEKIKREKRENGNAKTQYFSPETPFVNMTSLGNDKFEDGIEFFTNNLRIVEDLIQRIDSENTKDNHASNLLSDKLELLNLSKTFLSTGNLVIQNLPVSNEILNQISINKQDQKTSEKALSDALKGILGLQYNFGAFDLNEENPHKPTMPVVKTPNVHYKINTGESQDFGGRSLLFIPGGYSVPVNSTKYGYGSAATLSPPNFPAYNKVLGQVALLESPRIEFFYQDAAELGPKDLSNETVIRNTQVKYNLKLNELNIALNDVLDFDFDETNSYVNIEVKILGKKPVIVNDNIIGSIRINSTGSNQISNSNIYLSSTSIFGDVIEYTFNSKWIKKEDVSQYLFSLNATIEDFYRFYLHAKELDHISVNPSVFFGTNKLVSIKLKVLHDMYFEQVSPFGEQVNSTQVYTYLIYSKVGNVAEEIAKNVTQITNPDVLPKYLAGQVQLNSETIDQEHHLVWQTTGNTIYINAEKLKINGTLKVADGYNLEIQTLYPVEFGNGASITNNITISLKKDWYETPIISYASHEEKHEFCNSSKYKANQYSPIVEIDEPEENYISDPIHPFQFKLYPNPASTEVQIDLGGHEGNAVEITNTKGQTIMKVGITGNPKLNIEHLSSGLYIVRVYYTDGSTAVEKLIKL